MKENDFVFDLVRSLDERELKFIHAFAATRRRSPARVLELLEEFRGLETYNSRNLKLRFSNFEVLKFKLKNLVMRSLRLMEDKDSPEWEIVRHLENEAILYRRGLYGAARKELESARAIAENHQHLGRLLEIMLLEQHRCLETNTKNLVEEVDERAEAIFGILRKYVQEIGTVTGYQRLFAAFRTHEKYIAEGLPPLQNAFPAPETSDSASFSDQLYRHLAESLLARADNNLLEAANATRSAIRLMEAHPETQSKQQHRYRILLANYGVYLIPQRRFEEVEEIIGKLEKIEDRNFNEEAETYQNIAHLRLLVMLNTLQFNAFDEVFAGTQEGLTRYGAKVNPARLFSIWYNLLLLSILAERYQSAEQLLSQIQDNRRIQVRQEVKYLTRLLGLIVAHELESWDLPDNAVTAARQYFYRNEELTSFKTIVLSAISRLSATPINERMAVFQEMEAALIPIRAESSPTDRLGLDVVLAWTRSKINALPVCQCLPRAESHD